MSVEAIQYVEALAASGTCRSVTSSEWLVLRTLAFFHNAQVNCAWASVEAIAKKSCVSERTVQRVLAKLETRGLAVRHAVRHHGGGGPQTTNEYELPGMQSTAVGPEGRQQVFKASRTRVATQLRLPAKKARVVEGVAGAVDSRPSALAVSPLPVTPVVTPTGVTSCHPLEVRVEESVKRSTPSVGFRGSANVENGKGYLVKATASATATAEATATATTRASEAAVASNVGGGETGISSARAAVIEFPASARVRERARAQLDGSEAALYDETTRVLRECGVSPEGSTRRQRRAVLEALRLCVERDGCTIAAAGLMAVTRWRLYSADTRLLRWSVGVRLFFQDGLWLNVDAWPYDQAALSLSRRVW